jgi:hypothetical protein
VLSSWITLLVGATHLACAQPPSASSPIAPTPAPDSTATESPTPHKDHTVAPAPAEQWATFVAAWNTGDPAKLVPYTPSQDLLVLDNPGAFVRLTAFSSLSAYFTQPNEHDGARVTKLHLSTALKSETAPTANCESGVALTGSYLTTPARAQLVQRVQALADYKLAPADEVARLNALVQVIEAAAVFAVYDLDQSVGFLFAHNANGMSLVAVDAVVPCSA